MFCCAGADDAVNAHARSVTAFGTINSPVT